FNRCAPERLPCGFFELQLDSSCCDLKETQPIFLVPGFLIAIVDRLQIKIVRAKAAKFARTLKVFAKLISRDREQPSPERSELRVIVQSRDLARDNLENELGDIGCISVLKPPSPGELINHRPVNGDKLAPRLVVVFVAKAQQQAGASDWRR